jgi:hypothetical protein
VSGTLGWLEGCAFVSHSPERASERGRWMRCGVAGGSESMSE